jgi:hypothetical protein
MGNSYNSGNTNIGNNVSNEVNIGSGNIYGDGNNGNNNNHNSSGGGKEPKSLLENLAFIATIIGVALAAYLAFAPGKPTESGNGHKTEVQKDGDR